MSTRTTKRKMSVCLTSTREPTAAVIYTPKGAHKSQCSIALYLPREYRRKMAQQTSQSSTPRRIFLRFRTKDDAPSDSQIIQDFYEFSGLNDTLCFIHWQTREARDTYVVLDVHDGTSVLESSIQDLPHEVYQLSWKSESDAM